MWRPHVLQIKITENSTAELQSATQHTERGGGGNKERKTNERKV